jgi:hypothetical protein
MAVIKFTCGLRGALLAVNCTLHARVPHISGLKYPPKSLASEIAGRRVSLHRQVASMHNGYARQALALHTTALLIPSPTGAKRGGFNIKPPCYDQDLLGWVC